MRTIHKYELPDPGEHGQVMLPRGARVLHYGWQGNDDLPAVNQTGDTGSPYLWALVDTDAPVDEEHWFHVCGTGWEINDPPGGVELVHRATLQVKRFVWHVFEETEPLIADGATLDLIEAGGGL